VNFPYEAVTAFVTNRLFKRASEPDTITFFQFGIHPYFAVGNPNLEPTSFRPTKFFRLIH